MAMILVLWCFGLDFKSQSRDLTGGGVLLHHGDVLTNKRSPAPSRMYYLSRVVRNAVFCIRENKDADQLRGNREADQRLCFRYTDSTTPLVSKSEVSSHLLWLYSPVCMGPGRKPRIPVFSQQGSII